MSRPDLVWSACALLCVSAGAAASTTAPILFTNSGTNNIDLIETENANAVSTVVSYAGTGFDPDSIFHGLAWEGAVGGNLLVTQGRRFETSNIVRFEDVFGAQTQSLFSNADSGFGGALELAYDNANSRLISNSFPEGAPAEIVPGFYSIESGGTPALFRPTQTGGGFPRMNFATDVLVDESTDATNDYLALSLRGGANARTSGEFNNVSGSTLWRTDINGNLELVYDFSTADGVGSEPDGSFPIAVTSMAQLPDGDVVVTSETDAGLADILRLDLDENGDFVAISEVITGIVGTVQRVTYDFSTDTLVFNEEDYDDGSGNLGAIARVNLDGTGFTRLVTGVRASNILIAPAPGAMTLFGLGVLAGARRRRA